MFRKYLALAILALAPVMFTHSVQAGVLYNFSYDFDLTQSVSGQLEGDLQGDLDTIRVTDLFATIFTPSGPYTVDTTDDYFLGRNSAHDSYALVSLSGLLMDLVAHQGTSHGASCSQASALCLITPSSAWVGGSNVGYNASNWSISVAGATSSVPAPASLALLLLGLAGMGVVRRKAQGSATA